MSKSNSRPAPHNQNIAIAQHTLYQGIIPQSSEFKEYEHTLPGAADRILSLAEKQNRHRQKLELKAINTGVFQSVAGTLIGFAVSISCIVASVILALNGRETTASIIGGTTVIGLATTFVLGQKPQDKKQSK
jgi:uncharacterized membrane protein